MGKARKKRMTAGTKVGRVERRRRTGDTFSRHYVPDWRVVRERRGVPGMRPNGLSLTLGGEMVEDAEVSKGHGI